MRSVTMVQGFQYWLKLVAIMLPALFLLAAWRLDGGPSALVDQVPTFPADTRVSVGADTVITVAEPVTVAADATIDGIAMSGEVELAVGTHAIDTGAILAFPPVPRSRTWKALRRRPVRRGGSHCRAASRTRCTARTR